MRDNFWYKFLILFFGVLTVEDAIRVLFHADASEEVITVEAARAVDEVCVEPNVVAEEHVVILHEVRAVELQLSDVAEVGIHAEFISLAEYTVPRRFRVLEDEAVVAILTIDEMVAAALLAVHAVHSTVNLRFLKCLKAGGCHRHVTHELSHFLFILFRRIRLVEDVILLAALVHTSEAIVASDTVGAQRQSA